MTVHSKRSDDIAGQLVDVGFDSYRARGHAARNSRAAKRHQPVEDLMVRWRAELADVGITVDAMAAAVARESDRRIAGNLSADDLQRLVAELLGPDGRLAERKVFSRRDVVVAAAPHLFGHTLDVLDRVVDRVLADPAAIPLVGVPGAKQPAYAPACVIAIEHAIEAVVERGRHRTGFATLRPETVAAAIGTKHAAMGGGELTDGQRRAVSGITGSGHAVDLVIGVAGAGKTTALDVVRQAYEADGYTVLGTATSGQAARTLGRDANMGSSTLASLLWRLDHHRVRLDARTVVILDEAGMTDDPDLLRLLTAAESARAKVVMVGDDRQLGAVGPGGALRALAARHRSGVWVLDQNVRQADPTEREALDHLRAGDAAVAVDWMAANGRVAIAPDRSETIAAMVTAWAADIDAGSDSVMLAWRRANVDALNRAARQLAEERGQLHGPEITVSGGRRYRAGDRVVTLAPGGDGQIVTSERGTVTAVNAADRSVLVRMDDGRRQPFTAEETAKDRMSHGYAITVHRSQGATVDTAHRLEDGGGRELAYVSMSRARRRSTVWVVADDIDQAVDDLKADWPRENRQRWAIDSGTPSTDPHHVEHDPDADPSVRNALRQARLRAERDAVNATIPPDVSDELRRTRAAIAAQRQALADLTTGGGEWAETEIGVHVRHAATAQRARQQAVWRSNAPSASRAEVRAARREIGQADERLRDVRSRLETLTAPDRDRLHRSIDHLEHRQAVLEGQAAQRRRWLTEHPDTMRRLRHLDRELGAADTEVGHQRDVLDGIERPAEPPSSPLATQLCNSARSWAVPGVDLASEPDLGLGL